MDFPVRAMETTACARRKVYTCGFAADGSRSKFVASHPFRKIGKKEEAPADVEGEIAGMRDSFQLFAPSLQLKACINRAFKKLENEAFLA
jgi:hypothetical protein